MSNSDNLHITGDDTPAIVNLSKLITCEWIGIENITKLEWHVEGLENEGVGYNVKGIEIAILDLVNMSSITFNGKKFVCQVTPSSGKIERKAIALWLEGN